MQRVTSVIHAIPSIDERYTVQRLDPSGDCRLMQPLPHLLFGQSLGRQERTVVQPVAVERIVSRRRNMCRRGIDMPEDIGVEARQGTLVDAEIDDIARCADQGVGFVAGRSGGKPAPLVYRWSDLRIFIGEDLARCRFKFFALFEYLICTGGHVAVSHEIQPVEVRLQQVVGRYARGRV